MAHTCALGTGFTLVYIYMRPTSHRIGNPSETKYSVTNLVEVHPQVSNKGHPVDGKLVGAGSLWPTFLG